MDSLWGGNDYDRGVNTFNPTGRLFQVEYAVQAIKLGSTVIAIQTSDGVVIGAEKRVKQKCLVASSIKKVVQVTDVHIAGISGLTADGNMLLDKGRVEAENYKFTYNEHMPTASLVRRMCDFSMSFGDEDSKMARPLGVSMLVAGLDRVDEGKTLVPKLYHLDPSGTYIEYRAKAIGAGEETAMDYLVDHYNTSMSLDEALRVCLETLKNVMEEKVTNNNVDVWVLQRQDTNEGPRPLRRKIEGEEFTNLLTQVNQAEEATS